MVVMGSPVCSVVVFVGIDGGAYEVIGIEVGVDDDVGSEGIMEA